MSKIDTLNISFTDRNARRRGPTSSEAWNDIHDELASDLAGLYDQWNNRLKSLCDTIPDGTTDLDVDAFTDGLDGQTIWVKNDATIADTNYWDTTNSRPNTIYEQFQDIYTYIDSSITTVQGGSTTPSASDITIVDSNSVFDSSEVESALYELYTLFANSFLLSGSGSPEGVVTANVGAVYTRTDGGANTTLYIKESGTGNTGWVAK